MTESVSITIDSGKDAGKTFVIHKMPLLAGDKWANQVALALLRSGVSVAGLMAEDEEGRATFVGLTNMAGVLDIALRALGGVEDYKAQLLLDELMKYVKFQLPGGGERPVMLTENGCDVEEIGTLWKLRIAAIKVNLDFLKEGVTQS